MAMADPTRVPVPLSRRPIDWLILVFLALNATVITYMVDLEQLVIADPADFDYPPWPPPALVDLVHWYGEGYDPLLMARPPFWQMTIWIDVLFFGPFYFFAIYAFVRGRDWIRVPALVWSGTMAANVLILLFEERYGQWASPAFGMVLAANASWLVMPCVMIWRMWRDHPFTAPREPEPPPPTEGVAALRAAA
jgi:hypothetical protein